MGYRTYYSLQIEDASESHDLKAVIEDLRQPESEAFYAFDDEGCSTMETTWYEHDEDLKEFSKKYPDLVFGLTGTGDDSTDLWSTYYKNGKMQHCPVEFIYPPYDETKLI